MHHISLANALLYPNLHCSGWNYWDCCLEFCLKLVLVFDPIFSCSEVPESQRGLSAAVPCVVRPLPPSEVRPAVQSFTQQVNNGLG